MTDRQTQPQPPSHLRAIFRGYLAGLTVRDEDHDARGVDRIAFYTRNDSLNWARAEGCAESEYPDADFGEEASVLRALYVDAWLAAWGGGGA